jgi:hypothetical protein
MICKINDKFLLSFSMHELLYKMIVNPSDKKRKKERKKEKQKVQRKKEKERKKERKTLEKCEVPHKLYNNWKMGTDDCWKCQTI